MQCGVSGTVRWERVLTGTVNFVKCYCRRCEYGGVEMGIPIALLIDVRDVPRHDFAALIARMDRLLAEAAAVREQMAAALRHRWQQPFWPDRRRTYQQFSPERRRFQMEPSEG